MKPKFIFSSVFAIASLMFFVLPQLSAKSTSSAYAAAPAAIVQPVTAQQAAAVQASPTPQPLPTQTAPAAVVAAPPAEPPAQTIPLTAGPALADFAASLINQQPNVLVGVYVKDLFALPVVQQPGGNTDYVSPMDGTLTQYNAPLLNGVVGILAHNYLSGRTFFQLQENQEVVLVYGDGRTVRYRITMIDSFQALNSTNPYSDFIDLNDPYGAVQSFSAVYDRFYASPGQLVFQTCIEANGDPSWGRIFIVAEPL